MNDYQVAVYYFPNYHLDHRNERWHGKGWTEWALVKGARPRFQGHQQPKVPLWGYEDESRPEAMQKKIDAAADNGVSAFIFDWYWYEDGPFLQNALETGFIGAPNNRRLKFALMWANHDWVDIHPAQRSANHNVLASGVVSPEAFTRSTDHMIQSYFGHPSYWRVKGGLYLSIYHLRSLVQGFGSLEAVGDAISDFRARVRAAGHGELHLNAVVWGKEILPGEGTLNDVNSLLDTMGFDSVTSYTWVHHFPLTSFPTTPYAEVREMATQGFEEFTRTFTLPYYPHVSMGWDPSPRTIQTDVYDNLGYPFTPVLAGNTPCEFEKALLAARDFLDKGLTKPKILTINAWNEWTEGSYLEPDVVHGMAYLEAIRRVFGPETTSVESDDSVKEVGLPR